MSSTPPRHTSIQLELAESLDSAGRIGQYRDTLAAGEDLYITAGKRGFPGIPQIEPGDTLVFGPYIWGKIRPGCIVLYLIGDKPLVARVALRTVHNGRYALKTNLKVTRKGTEEFRYIAPDQVLAVLKAVIRQSRRIPSWQMTRGLIDWVTDYGTRNPLGKLLDLLFLPLPRSWRPTYKI